MLVEKYRKNVLSLIITEAESEPTRNSVLTRSILVDMFPKKLHKERSFNISLSKNIQTALLGSESP